MNKKMLSIVIIVAIVLIGILVFAFVGNPGSTVAPTNNSVQTQNNATQTANVSIENFAFNPATLTIKTGERVMWQNNDTVPHSIVGDGLSSSVMKTGEGFSFVFSQAGEYNYHCGIHPSMQGKIIVK